ncbi:hypothetical protein BU23DRAFT_522201 [Bimuria novae-zelandiae CBS 107.79]|uniref:HAUS augmin-like complex subunit 6 N-terminal domain-containing protein n=1 Tax=Bimuria novae-zelandiae CBS 107.79 TaxID=1447943 RepID=A0A6A5VUG2_9PLEO|nr:hypothetical protein BU23DRAFT_522201 [Bimuria novae-zelandiae CBS 107.79]
MSRTTSQTSTASGPAANGVARSLPLKTNNRPALSNPLQTSDIKLFVTNLRLLDLDRRQDWPNITVQTFSAKNADQKQRIGAVEWSLFRLFEMWDPVETSQKLQPFFPPLEPLQSRNLRIALHRSLDALKKDGILGREAVLRKTMLDECKGEKFYEILASFSAVVLKKSLASHKRQAPNKAVARTLTTSATLSSQGQASLLPLAIAHKAALTNLLRRKEEKRRRYTEFGHLLDAKAEEINRRIRKTAETPRASKPAVPQKEADAIKKQLKDNWVGDQRWVDVMLHGDDVQVDAVFLNTSFKKVWQMVEQGRRLEDAVPEIGLLENLQLRVEEQKTRLERWKEFREKIQSEDESQKAHPTKTSALVKDLKFDSHLQLQLSSKLSEREPTDRRKLRPAYQDILVELDEELSQAASTRYSQSSMAPSMRSGRVSRSPVQHQISRSRSDSIPKNTASLPKIAKPRVPSRIKLDDIVSSRPTLLARPTGATPVDSEATLVGQTFTRRTAPVSPAADSPTEQLPHLEPTEDVSDAPSASASPEETPAVEQPSPPSSPPPRSSYYPSEPPILELPSLSTEEALAAQIVSTVGDATPSPAKKPQPRLSLMERTRMSMVRTTSFEPISESPSLPDPPTSTVEDRHAALMERTRLSMAALSAKPKSRASLAPNERKKPARPSQVFPVNQFDTPRRARKSEFLVVEEEVEENEKTPKEDLFSDDVDYDRVFRSRPKIATSPVFGTPVVEEADGFDEGVTGVDLADVDNEEDGEPFEHESPLRGRFR